MQKSLLPYTFPQPLPPSLIFNRSFPHPPNHAFPSPISPVIPSPNLLNSSILRRTPHIRTKRRRVPRLHVHRPRTRELTHQPFARGDTGDDPPGSDAFEDVLAVPGDEVAVVYYVALAFDQLRTHR
jgi:hypothetical protein